MDCRLNAKCKTIMFLEENIGEHLDGLVFDNELLNAMPKTWSMKKKKLISLTSLGLKSNL